MLPLKVWPNHYIQPYQPCSKANIRKIFNNSPCPFLIFLPPHVGRSLLWMAERESGEVEKPGTPIGIHNSVYPRVSVTLGQYSGSWFISSITGIQR